MAEQKSDVIVAEKKGRWWSTKKKVIGEPTPIKPITKLEKEPCQVIQDILDAPDLPPEKPQMQQPQKTTDEKQMNVKEYLMYRLQEIAGILDEYIVIQEDEEAKRQQINALEEQLKKLKA